MGQSPGDSKVRFLLGAEGGRLRTSKVPGKRAASHARGAGSMVGEWGGGRLGATWVLLCGSQIRELVRLGQGQPG